MIDKRGGGETTGENIKQKAPVSYLTDID